MDIWSNLKQYLYTRTNRRFVDHLLNHPCINIVALNAYFDIRGYMIFIHELPSERVTIV